MRHDSPAAAQIQARDCKRPNVTLFPPPPLFDLSNCSQPLPGLIARLDKLVYHHGGKTLPANRPHAFVYFVTIHNGSDLAVTLLGRKWIIRYEDGMREILEGDKIVGETPRLCPGEQWSYNSYHVTGANAHVQGCFHGLDEMGRRIHVSLAPFELVIPPPGVDGDAI